MKLVLGTASCLAILIAANGAQAAQRYASPAGSGTECSLAKPCSLQEAITSAKANDEVIVTAGPYTLPSPINLPFEATNVNIHGDYGGPMPTVTGSTGGALIFIATPGSRLSYLDLQNNAEAASAIFCSNKAAVDRVRASVSGTNATAVLQAESCTVRDSVIRASGTNATALSASLFFGNATAVARNVTAIATGSESVGVRSAYLEIISHGSFTLDLRNAIASGEKADLLAVEGSAGLGNIVVSNSNFDVAQTTGSAQVTDAGGNQTAAPLFVDAANGDYREAVGSPTIDAGVNDQLGPLDLAGSARIIGAAPDIGAFEFVPPAGELRSITFKPLAFRAANAGGAVISRKRKPRAPVGSTVTYNLSAPTTVAFTFERAVKGRRVGGKCRRATKANRAKKKCTFYKPIKGGFSVTGSAPLNNSFRFSGRIEHRALKPGTYKIVGRAGTTLKRGLFKIVR